MAQVVEGDRREARELEKRGEPTRTNTVSLENRKASRISRVIEQGSYRDEESWPEDHDAMIDAMIRFEKALRAHLSRPKAQLMPDVSDKNFQATALI